MDEDDFCTYDESNEWYTTCINPVHIDLNRNCARVGDVELGCRIADLTNTLDLVLRQLNAQVHTMEQSLPRMRYRFIRQHLTASRDKLHAARIAFDRKEEGR